MSNKTIAQQLNIKEFPFTVKNKNGNIIYYETSTGFWYKSEYDSNGKETYFENSRGFWSKREYDSNRNEIYFENSDGKVIDNRPKAVELTLDEIAILLNIPVELLKIKK